MRIVTLGDNCIDVYNNLGTGCPGGGPVNVAVHVARQGVAAAYVGAFGTDRNGDIISEALLAEGVDISEVRRLPGPTAVAWVRLENGDRTFIGRDRGIRERLVVDNAIRVYAEQADLIHITLDSCMDAEVPRWKAHGKRISYDFSHRATAEQLELLPMTDIAFFSGQKIDPADAADAARHFHSLGAGIVVITLGAHGSVCFDGARMHRQSAEPIEPVDTLGAGDGYIAGFVVSLCRHGDVAAAMVAGTQIASGVCSHRGGFGHETAAIESRRQP